MLSVSSRWQALKLSLAAAVVVVVEITNKFTLKVFHGFKCLQIEQLTFEQPEEILNDGIVQTSSFAAHALADAPFASNNC